LNDTKAPPGSSATPRRELSLVDSTAVIVGIIIGSGLYETTPLVARSAGSPPALAIVWLVGGAFALVGALCYAELACAHPVEGGDYVYLTRAYGRTVGLLFAWTQLLVIRPGSIGTMALVFARYAAQLAGEHGPSRAVWAAVAVASLSLVNMLGVRQGKWVQNVLTAAKVLGLVGVLAIGCCASPVAANEPIAASASTDSDIGLALILVLFAYSGWNEMANVAAEVRDPRRNIVRALVAGTSSVAVIYLAVNGAMVHALGFAGLVSSSAAATDTVRPVLGEHGVAAMALLVCISTLGAMNGMTFTGSRIYYALGREHRLFARLGQWNARTGTPLWALALEGSITVAAVVAFGSLWEEAAFSRLVIFTAPLFWLFLGLAVGALIVLRRREPALERPVRVPLYPLTPLVFAAGCAWMLWSSVSYAVANRSWEALWPVVVLASGLAIAWLERRRATS